MGWDGSLLVGDLLDHVHGHLQVVLFIRRFLVFVPALLNDHSLLVLLCVGVRCLHYLVTVRQNLPTSRHFQLPGESINPLFAFYRLLLLFYCSVNDGSAFLKLFDSFVEVVKFKMGPSYRTKILLFLTFLVI